MFFIYLLFIDKIKCTKRRTQTANKFNAEHFDLCFLIFSITISDSDRVSLSLIPMC